MLKILQARLQKYVKWECPEVQDGFTKGRGTTDQIASIQRIIEKAREFQKNICFSDYAKAFVWITTNWKIHKEIGIPDRLTCLLRNLYAGQKTTVRTRHGTMDWFQIGKGVSQGDYIYIYCHPAYLTSMQSTACEMLNLTHKWNQDCQEKYQQPH